MPELKLPEDRGRTVPNQRVLKELVLEPCDTDNIYAKINIDALQIAMLNLNGAAFKLWVYFSKNAPTHKGWAISPVEIERWGIPKASYYKAFDELVSFGYLTTTKKDSNQYTFHQIPRG